MPRYINLSLAEQNEILIRAAEATRISPILLEKDFWVSWILNKIFQMNTWSTLVFKGGTSLSKCYGLIHRFSEDIDITIDKAAFQAAIDVTELSGKKFQKLLKENDSSAGRFIRDTFTVDLEHLIADSLKPRKAWRIVPDECEPKNLRFFYPAAISGQGNSYTKQSVLIEMGIRGGTAPCESKEVVSYVENHFDQLLEREVVKIRTLSPVRTFWEKITLLHAENNRPTTKQMGDRMSRHYYDVHQMLQSDIQDKALGAMGILKDVIENKMRYFKSSWAQYDTAIPGSLTIVPNSVLLKSLERDYKNMEAMIFGAVPTFANIIQAIQKFEDVINAHK